MRRLLRTCAAGGALLFEGVGAWVCGPPVSAAVRRAGAVQRAAAPQRGAWSNAHTTTTSMAVELPTAHEVEAFTATRKQLLSTYDAVRLCARHESASDSVTIDLLGDTLLVQTWKEPITADDTSASALRLADDISAVLGTPQPLKLFFSHRGRGIRTKTKGRDGTYDSLKADLEQASRWGGGVNATMTEAGLKFLTLLSPARDPGLHLVSKRCIKRRRAQAHARCACTRADPNFANIHVRARAYTFVYHVRKHIRCALI